MACKKNKPLKFDDGLPENQQQPLEEEKHVLKTLIFSGYMFFVNFGAVDSGCMFFFRDFTNLDLIRIPSLFESIPFGGEHFLICLVVSTHLSFPQVGVKRKNKPPPSNKTPVMSFLESFSTWGHSLLLKIAIQYNHPHEWLNTRIASMSSRHTLGQGHQIQGVHNVQKARSPGFFRKNMH